MKERQRFKTASSNARKHSLHSGGFILNERGNLLFDEGDFVQVPRHEITKINKPRLGKKGPMLPGGAFEAPDFSATMESGACWHLAVRGPNMVTACKLEACPELLKGLRILSVWRVRHVPHLVQQRGDSASLSKILGARLSSTAAAGPLSRIQVCGKDPVRI